MAENTDVVINETADKEWFYKGWIVLLALWIFFPLGLVLAIKKKSWTKKIKAIFIIIFACVFLFNCVEVFGEDSEL